MIKNSLIVYEIAWVIRRIYEVSDRLRTSLVDQTLFEERCIDRVGEYLNKDKDNKHHRRYIERMIKEVASSVSTRNRNEYAELFISLSIGNEEEDEEIEFEPEDVLTDVESEIMKQETIALLTQDDRSKKVLEAWSIGNTNNTEISRMLTHTLGGKTESHRKFIQRFEKDCREKLATAI